MKDDRLRRIPFVSALTMLESQEIIAHHYSHQDMGEVPRRPGSEPRQDLRELYRRMAFNILVDNDDDHLRNHAVMYDGRGRHLSPLYDVVLKPRIDSDWRLILRVGGEGRAPTLRNTRAISAAFGLQPGEAAAMLEDLRGQVETHWEPMLREAGIGPGEIERLAPCFAESRAPQ